ncbi:recombinase family protein [Shimazuella kribbensis]|uniref:recombinase family protein n=1 Tax=Shimazuella kribbensis TaxID=139808 RepID=UPI00040543BA|nr:recombinase family protein [Shimazuella kribbensis]
MKTAIYARVSTGLQAVEGTSLDTQVEMCTEKAQALGLYQLEIYKESGASGEDIERPEMDRLRQDIAQGKIAKVICVHPDRLSRNLVDKLIVCGEWERHEVELIFCDAEYQNTPEGQLFFNMQSAIAQYELSMIRKRTSRGRLKAVEKQKKIMPMRSAPFGYELIDAKLVINEDEAKVVHQIYEWYVYQHHTYREIGNKLVELGILPKRKESKNWNQSSIYRILSNEVYIGLYRYNRRKVKKIKGEKTISGNPKKSYEFRDSSQWVTTKVPAIIDKVLFKLAQQQKEKNTTNKGNNRFEYLLKGMIRCGHCGRIWSGTTYTGRINKQTGKKERYRCYRCPNKNPRKFGEDVEKCPTKTLQAEVIEEYIWNLIIRSIVDKDEIVSQLKEASTQHDQRSIETIKALKKRINEKDKERNKVKIMFTREVITEDEMFRDLSKINKDIKSLQTELQKIQHHLEAQRENEEEKERVKMVIDFLGRLVEKESDIPFEKKRFIIQCLINEIILTFNKDQTNCDVTCVGHLDVLLDRIDIVSRSQHEEI